MRVTGLFAGFPEIAEYEVGDLCEGDDGELVMRSPSLSGLNAGAIANICRLNRKGRVMSHPLVLQLRFARSELQRGLVGVTDDEARQRFLPMNCISWMIGHLAGQEQRYWLDLAQGKVLSTRVYELTAHGRPATTPPLADMLEDWRQITQEADSYLDTLTTETLQQHFVVNGKTVGESAGTLMERVIYHYWFHIGESQAVRQLLGHTNLPEYVGDIGAGAPYRPEA